MTGRHGLEPPRPDRRQARITIVLAVCATLIMLAAAAACFAKAGVFR
jgi:hypothetical protein